MLALLALSAAAVAATNTLSVDLAPARKTDLSTQTPGLDAACLHDAAHPMLPRSLDLPATGSADAIVVTWTGSDALPEKGLAATVTLEFADGQTALFRGLYGLHLFGTATTGRLAAAHMAGTRPDGTPLILSEWILPIGRSNAAITRIRIDARGPVGACILDVRGAPVPGLNTRSTDGWYPYAMATHIVPVAPALGIEAPAGARGFLQVRPDGHLWFEDGTRARFWGINLVGEPAIPAKEDADAYAATLAALGFNMVRMHHIDGPSPRGVLARNRTSDPATWLDPERTDRLDFFLSRLKAHGLYLFLEVATEREFQAVDGVSNPGGLPNGHKSAPMWEDDWNDAYLRWFEAFWGRVNPYTKLRYADDPFVGMVELANEHTILLTWGMGLENLPPAHLAALDQKWNAWLRTRYPNDAALAAAWEGSSYPGLRPGESLGVGPIAPATVAREPRFPALMGRWPKQRARDLYTFYAELELGFYKRVEAKAKTLGFRVPLVPSITYDQPILQLLQAPWQVTDEHAAWDQFRGQAWTDVSALASPEQHLAYSLSAVEGRAAAVTELNHPWPNQYRAEGPLVWATLASVQDWDVLLWFNWSDSAWPGDPKLLRGSYDLRSTPVTIAQLPAASAIFRMHTVPTAPGAWAFNVPAATVVNQYLAPETHVRQESQRPLEAADLAFVLSHRIRSTFLDTPPATVPGSPTPGVGWWADPGVLLLDLPTAQARVGPPASSLAHGTGVTALASLDVRLSGWAAVSLVTTDGLPLGQSRRALLAVSTRQENSGTVYANQGSQLVGSGYAPVLVEPAVGIIRFRWPEAPQVRVLGPDGIPGRALKVRRSGKGWWEVEMSDVKAPWFVVETP